MTKINIQAQVPGFTGQVIGVPFVDSKASIEVPRQQAAFEYFTRHGYVLEGGDDDGDAKAAADESGHAADAKAYEEQTIPELIALAEQHGYELGSAKKKADIIAAIVAAETEAAQRRDAAAKAPTAAGNVGPGAQPGAEVGATDVNAEGTQVADAQAKVADEVADAKDAADEQSSGDASGS